MENKLRRDGKVLICGIDEVGRGCLAGPLVAAAVVLPEGCRMRLHDSKLLNREARELLAPRIQDKAIGYGLGWVSNTEIDEMGMTWAVTLAYERALEELDADVSSIIIDGNYNYLADYDIAETLVKADQKVACVAAASIIAKVARDNYMYEFCKRYPEYCWDSNVGYATRKHRDAIAEYGLTDLHRQSFCKNFV
jgi:ribonuclease HII